MDDFFKINPWLTLLFILIFYGLSTYIVQEYVITEEVYYNTFGEQLTIERVSEILSFQKDLLYFRLALIPLVVILQIVMIVIIINTGFLLANIKISFKKLFGIVTKCSLFFAIGKVLQLIVALASNITNLEDFQKTDIFSISGILTNIGLAPHELLVYPLSLINIFDITFVVFVGVGISLLLNRERQSMIKLVAISYGVGMLLWALCVIFMQINLQ